MIDFTGCPVNKFKGYGGANGNKINIEYNGVSYMLKFPPVPSKNKCRKPSLALIPTSAARKKSWLPAGILLPAAKG